MKPNWFPTLNESLDSEGLVSHWPVGTNIQYGTTVDVKVGKLFISVYRDERGFYERPIYYKTA